METNFDFKSAICTSRSQSERLLGLGLKKETADMYRPPSWGGNKIIGYYVPDVVVFSDQFTENSNDLPAWSFDRLWEILPKDVEIDDDRYISSHLEGEDAIIYHDYGSEYYNFDKRHNRYDNIIDCIEWLIKEGYFNKEYLCEK